MRCLYTTLKRLSRGDFTQPTTHVNSILRGHWDTKSPDRIDWKEELKRTYIWIDYQSIPQVTDRPTNLGRDKDREATAAAIASLPSYIWRCRYVFIITPEMKHEKRGYINFRTWSKRGWCKFELLCEYLSDEATKVFHSGRCFSLEGGQQVHFESTFPSRFFFSLYF